MSIFSLGSVGTACAGCLLSEDHTVVGAAVNQSKVGSTNAGVAPLVEPKQPELLVNGHETNRPSATTSAVKAIQATAVEIHLGALAGDFTRRRW